MGFGARGIGMGNAMIAVPTGDLVGYYNPAILPKTPYANLSASMGILALDRKLNFLSYATALPPNAGLSVGIINSGVSEIDGRNGDGDPTGPLRTSENQVLLSFGNRFQGGFNAGITLKLLQHHLYTDVNSLTVGLDFGILIPAGDHLTFGAVVKDINSKYEWDTNKLYGQSGSTSTDKFPLLYAAGASYLLPDSLGIVALDIEASNASTLTARGGVEVALIPELVVRGGIDRIDLKENGNGIRPSLGFTLKKGLEDSLPVIDATAVAVNYAYVFEPFAASGIHMISLSLGF